MDFVFIVFVASIFLILGCVGAVLPILPGPLLSYIGLLIIHFFLFEGEFLTNNEIIVYADNRPVGAAIIDGNFPIVISACAQNASLLIMSRASPKKP